MRFMAELLPCGRWGTEVEPAQERLRLSYIAHGYHLQSAALRLPKSSE